MTDNPYAAPAAIVTDIISSADEQVLATRLQRLWASIIDSLILVAVCAALGGAIGFISAFNGGGVEWMEGEGWRYNLVTTVVAFVVYLALNISAMKSTGQTLGKRMIGIRVVQDSDGEQAPLPLLLKRCAILMLPGVVPVAGNIFSFANVVLIFRASHKCIHDDICATRVIKA
ncbi:MAG: RDD family protein [Moraxellaceae bacterium]|nr:RDD family protein [Moraxellaceae bacterium]